MSIIKQRLGAALAVAALAVASNATAQGANGSGFTGGESAPSPEAMTADVLLVRPLGVAATLIGTGIFVIGLPFEAITGNISTTARALVGGPAKFTFQRPIGESH